MTLALVGWRMEPLDWVALVVIVWLALAVVAGPLIGTFIDRAAKIADGRTRRAHRRRRHQPAQHHRPKLEDQRPLGYRPPRD